MDMMNYVVALKLFFLLLSVLTVFIFVLFEKQQMQQEKESNQYADEQAPILLYHPKSKIKLIHVMNTYTIQDENTGHYAQPYDQWSTLQSIERALKYVPHAVLEVDFVCAVFESDLRHLPSDIDLPCRKEVLTRSTKTEYEGSIMSSPMKELPFLQDIIDVASAKYIKNNATATDFFVMLTNSDIGLSQFFYNNLLPLLHENNNHSNQDAISINRLTIPMKNITQTMVPPVAEVAAASKLLLSEIDNNLQYGVKHPGFDCFVMSSKVLQTMNIGMNIFAGYPPWGSLLDKQLQIMAINYTNYKSSSDYTFHLGDDGSKWKDKDEGARTTKHDDNDDALFQQFKNLTAHYLSSCPKKLFGDHPYTYINTINCGRLWSSSSSLINNYNNNNNSTTAIQGPTDNNSNNNKNHDVPNFVQPGYEDHYRQGMINKKARVHLKNSDKKQEEEPHDSIHTP